MTNFLFEPPFAGLKGNIRTSSIAVGKRVADFLFAIIELFALALTVETLQANIGRIRRFFEGVGHFEPKF